MGRDGQLEMLLSVSRGKNRQINIILSALFLLCSLKQHLAVLHNHPFSSLPKNTVALT